MTFRSVQNYGVVAVRPDSLIGPVDSIGQVQHAQRKISLANGTALRRHAEDAHRGVVDATCPGCRELQRKMAEAAK